MAGSKTFPQTRASGRVWACAEPIAPPRALSEDAAAIALARSLVRMRDDLPLPVRVADLRWDGADRDELGTRCERLGATGLPDRVPKFCLTA